MFCVNCGPERKRLVCFGMLGELCLPPRFKRLKVCLSFHCANTEFGVQQNFFLLSSLGEERFGFCTMESQLQISTALKWSACCRKEVDEPSRGCSGLLKWHNTLLMFFPLLILALSPFSSFSFLLLLLWMCHIEYCRDSTAELWYSPSAPSLGCVFPRTVIST